MTDIVDSAGAADSDIARIVELQLGMMRNAQPRERGQHAKAHGVVAGEFEVLDGHDEDVSVGLFARPATYTAYVRFSNGSQGDDEKPDVHGMAIKLFGTAEPGAPESVTQDFILADNPVFFIRDAAEYLRFIEDFARTAPQGRAPLSFMAWLLLHHPQDLPVLLRFPHHVQDSPLAAKYWSQVPYAFGDRVCRYSVTPDPANAKFNAASVTGPQRLQGAMIEHLTDRGLPASFDFFVQIREGADSGAIDNPTVEWNAPVRRVARLTLPAQAFASPAQMAFCEALRFTPWHALPAHRPLGQINAIRRAVYEASSALRHVGDPTAAPPPEPRGDELAQFASGTAVGDRA